MTTTPNTTASGAADALRAAMMQAFNLGQIYWQQADSESYAEQGKSVSTYKKYKALLEETCTPLAECAPAVPTQPTVLSEEQIKAHGDRASGMMARDLTRFDAACEVMKYLKEQGAPYYYMYRMGIVLHGNYEGTEVARAPDKAAPVAPAPQPAGYVLVPVEPTQEMEDAAYRNSSTYGSGPGADYRAMLGAAPKVDHIADVSKMVPAPLQQGEYLPLPVADTHCYDEDTGKDVWSHSAEQMRAYVDAHLAARGAAQAAPDNRVPEAWTNLLAYALQDDMHNRLTPRVVDIAYTAFMQAKRPNDEDGGASDWLNDTKPKVAEMIAKLRKDLIEERAAQPAPVAEDADPLQDAANWLVTSRATTSATELGSRLCIGYNRADRLFNAARAQAAQPEGAKP